MDAEQLRTLRQWADGLARDDRPEVRAAARAISLLVEEVESLRAALLTQMPPGEDPPLPGGGPADALGEEALAADAQHELRTRLRALARFGRREPAS
jgi:hypothetical protein